MYTAWDSSNLRGDLPAGGVCANVVSSPGPVLLKRHVRTSKIYPLVDEVELLQANPQYAHIRHADGRETTVSIRHLAPCGDTEIFDKSSQQLSGDNTTTSNIWGHYHDIWDQTPLVVPVPDSTIDPPLRRSQRHSHRAPPDHYEQWNNLLTWLLLNIRQRGVNDMKLLLLLFSVTVIIIHLSYVLIHAIHHLDCITLYHAVIILCYQKPWLEVYFYWLYIDLSEQFSTYRWFCNNIIISMRMQFLLDAL